MNITEALIRNIPSFEDGGISMADLAAKMNLNPRDLRRLIADVRRSGHVICSTSYGYYLPSTLPELSAYARYMLSRIECSWESLMPALPMMIQWDNPAESQITDIIDRLKDLNEIITNEIAKMTDSAEAMM